MRTQEDGEFLTLNGVQTQSGAALDLLDQAQALAQLGWRRCGSARNRKARCQPSPPWPPPASANPAPA